jgi:hypothetical protein
MVGDIRRYAAPVFSANENSFLRCYAASLDRVQAMQQSGLAEELQIPLNEVQRLEEAAAGVIRKAERLSFAEVATALGADKIAMVKRLWDICLSAESHQAIKGLQLLARIHGLWADTPAGGRTSVAIVLNAPEQPKPATPPGLPFSLEPPGEALASEA